MWQQWVNGILGLWIILLPFLNLAADTFTWTAIITGIAIAALGFWGAASHQSYHERGEKREQRQAYERR